MNGTQHAVLPGFADPVLDAQRVFRGVLMALSRPGTVHTLEAVPTPAPLNPASMAVCLALLDFETPLWLDPAARDGFGVSEHLRFHCGCPITEATADAAFALVCAGDLLPPLVRFRPGSDLAPEGSTTLIVQVQRLEEGSGWTLSGPGIRHTARLRVEGLPAGFPESWRVNQSQFPRGVDLILTCGNRVAGLPRTTRLEP